MISDDDRKAVISLQERGIGRKHIARLLGIDIKSVRRILAAGGQLQRQKRKDKIDVAEELLRSVYSDCKGYMQRMHEVLTEEHKLSLSYSTLRRLLFQYGIGVSEPQRSERVADIPGEEMQHDTSEHWIEINGKRLKLICSGLYLRYSKMRYIKYYRRFNRFVMKCFMDEALRFWGHSARRCIIDNTSLAIDYGSGSNAVFSNKMVVFARKYGFEWYAHAIGHANRKAGKERNFHTVETNFIPGRTFNSLQDLNRQAFEWATDRYAHRPQSKTGLIPSQLFEHEKASLIRLPEFIHPPSQPHERIIDQYGYITFDGNFYWVPPTQAKKVTLIQYANHIVVYESPNRRLIEHQCFDELIRNEVTPPPKGKKTLRSGKPKNIKHDYRPQQKELEKAGAVVTEYLAFILSKDSGVCHKGKYVRQLHAVQKKTTPQLFTLAIQRALKYKVTSIHHLHNIFSQILKQPSTQLFASETISGYESRPEYMAGRFTQENELELPLD
ncbi:MAG: helix-turn-helix domain-containing protein [Chitinivibrionales bacterium]